ncbi:MAG: hypothetical protein DI603_12635 [Roseateles depolymerans]|uniref:H.8-like outer-membrane lipoprotein n=1 Tax=Roseateles depolymerans TaxID=76731 RepID=A0A2W5DH55_9BURK|nr:MAG: hypothetical protein DI603_12635 [Roseateles depolymerans]
MKKSILLASLLAAVALSACSKKAEEPVAAPAPVASEPAPVASEPASAASAADAGASAADAGASAASK